MPGWDYLVAGGCGREEQPNPAWRPDLLKAGGGQAQPGTARGGGRAWPKLPHPPLTSPGSTLKSVCSTTPKSGAGSSLGRVRRVRVWPPPRDSANLGDRQGGHWRLWISSASVLCGVGWSFADWVEILALPPRGAQGRISVFRPVRCLPYRVIAAEIKWA